MNKEYYGVAAAALLALSGCGTASFRAEPSTTYEMSEKSSYVDPIPIPAPPEPDPVPVPTPPDPEKPDPEKTDPEKPDSVF